MEEYNAARQQIQGKDRPALAPYSYDALIVSFYRTNRWQKMRPSSQNTYRGIIERFRKRNGSKDVRGVSAATIDALLNKMGSTPAAANNLRKTLKRLHRHATLLGWRTDNPVDATDPYQQGAGWHCWTEAEIAQFEAKWPVGTRERLAMSLLLYTALRRSDMVSMGRQHRRGDELHLRHGKNDSETVIPIMPALAKVLDAVPRDQMTYLETSHGKPYTPNGFGNWFRRKCKEAGLKNCSAHGLRKAMSRRLAEAGATPLEGRAITGHKTDRMFGYYAESASKREMAKAASGKLVANLSGERDG
jgi:integrase